jgi:hypothetical protein
MCDSQLSGMHTCHFASMSHFQCPCMHADMRGQTHMTCTSHPPDTHVTRTSHVHDTHVTCISGQQRQWWEFMFETLACSPDCTNVAPIWEAKPPDSRTGRKLPANFTQRVPPKFSGSGGATPQRMPPPDRATSPQPMGMGTPQRMPPPHSTSAQSLRMPQGGRASPGPRHQGRSGSPGRQGSPSSWDFMSPS